MNGPRTALEQPLNSFCYEVFIALASAQVSRQVKFYRSLLGSEPTLSRSTYAEFRLPGLRLAIFSPKAENAAEFAAASSGPMSLCVEVNDLAVAIAHLTALGYPPPGSIMHTSHGQEIYAYDPDGNRLILHQR